MGSASPHTAGSRAGGQPQHGGGGAGGFPQEPNPVVAGGGDKPASRTASPEQRGGWMRWGRGGRLQPQETSVAPLAPRPAVPLRREEEEEVGIAQF